LKTVPCRSFYELYGINFFLPHGAIVPPTTNI